MLEAGRNNFAAFSSNRTRPVSSDVTLIPTIADASSGFLKTSEILVLSSPSDFVVLAVFGWGTTTGAGGAGSGVPSGVGCGAAAGVGVGVGVVFCVERPVVESCVALIRCARCLTDAPAGVLADRTIDRSSRQATRDARV